MQKLVLLRHGQSVWNQENRFTGWTDVDLSERGMHQAAQAGQLLKKHGFTLDVGFTSVLKRSIKTLHIVLEEMDLLWIPMDSGAEILAPKRAVLRGSARPQQRGNH